MVMQRSSWADEVEEFEEFSASEQLHGGFEKKRRVRRVRQRRHRRGGVRQSCFDAESVPKCEFTMEVNADDNATSCVQTPKRMPSELGAEESPDKNMYMHDEPLAVSGAQALFSNPELLIARLEDAQQRHETILLFLKWTRQLALSKGGCRIVQKAFEVAGSSDRDIIIAELKDHIVELYESPHGNHVLSKAIEVFPAAKVDFVISALHGRGIAVSKHRYGCRVVCRLIEHCTEEQIGRLLDEILSEADMLARNAYGNFVVSTALEHMSEVRRWAVLSQVLPEFGSLAMHRTGSLVVQKAFDYCCAKDQSFALRALLLADGEFSLIEVARSHYGSYVIAQLAGLQQTHEEALEVARHLASNMEYLQTSPYAGRVVNAFELAPTGQLASAA